MKLSDLIVTEDDVDKDLKFVDIRISNEYFNKLKISEYISLFFAMYGLFLSVLLYEITSGKEVDP